MDFLQTLDALPFIRRVAESEYGASVRRRILVLFPHRSAQERAAIFRGFWRYKFMNRLTYRATIAAPAAAAFVSRFVPVSGAHRLARANALRGPVIIATGHFGSLYLLSFIIARALPGRRLYLMHKKNSRDSIRDERFLRRRGIVPVGGDERGLLTLIRALRNDPMTGILLAFDPPLGKRHTVRFCGTQLPVSTGIGLLAEIGRCPVVPIFWHYDGSRPSVQVAEPIFSDPFLPQTRRRLAIVEALFALLEERVSRNAEQWQLDFLPDPGALDSVAGANEAVACSSELPAGEPHVVIGRSTCR